MRAPGSPSPSLSKIALLQNSSFEGIMFSEALMVGEALAGCTATLWDRALLPFLGGDCNSEAGGLSAPAPDAWARRLSPIPLPYPPVSLPDIIAAIGLNRRLTIISPSKATPPST